MNHLLLLSINIWLIFFAVAWTLFLEGAHLILVFLILSLILVIAVLVLSITFPVLAIILLCMYIGGIIIFFLFVVFTNIGSGLLKIHLSIKAGSYSFVLSFFFYEFYIGFYYLCYVLIFLVDYLI